MKYDTIDRASVDAKYILRSIMEHVGPMLLGLFFSSSSS